MTKTTLLIDGSPVLYSQWHTVGHLSAKDGTPTGLRFGFIRAVRSYTARTKADETIIVWDAPGTPVKAEGIESYKSDRQMTDDKREMYAQQFDVKAMLELTKYTQVIAPGYEADDIIGALTQDVIKDGGEAVICSPDADLTQLVTSKSKIYDPSRKKEGLRWRDAQTIFEESGVWPEHVRAYKTIGGDPSDNITGIQPRSEARLDTLRQMLLRLPRKRLKFAELMEKLHETSNGTADERGILKEVAARAGEFAQNFRLVGLHKPPKVDVTEGQRDVNALINLFQQLEFKSLMKFADDIAGTE